MIFIIVKIKMYMKNTVKNGIESKNTCVIIETKKLN